MRLPSSKEILAKLAQIRHKKELSEAYVSRKYAELCGIPETDTDARACATQRAKKALSGTRKELPWDMVQLLVEAHGVECMDLFFDLFSGISEDAVVKVPKEAWTPDALSLIHI